MRNLGLGRAWGGLMAAVAVVYANALGASFQFDDWSVVVGDPRVQSLAAWWAAMPGIRPVLKLTYALNHAVGFGSLGFHALNVVVHAASATLVLLLLDRFARREEDSRDRAPLAALAGAAIFALHPVQTEAVTYVSGRSTSLAALFALGSLLAWVEGRERRRRWLSIGLSPALFACALGVKETAVIVPAAILLWWATDRKVAPDLRGAAAAAGSHVAVLAVAAVAAAGSATYRHLLATSLGARGLVENLLTQAGAVAYLAGQVVRLDRLNADPMLPVVSSWSWESAAGMFLLVGILALGVATLRSRPAFAFGLLWFFLWLAPTNSILPRLDVVNDRQVYVALAGPAWLTGLALSRAPRRLAWAALGALCLVLGSATILRNRVYANEVVFWEDVARKAPHNARAFNNLGYAYALAGRVEDAEAALVVALDLAPGDVTAATNLKLLREGALGVKSSPLRFSPETED